jgi:hypothetical protein
MIIPAASPVAVKIAVQVAQIANRYFSITRPKNSPTTLGILSTGQLALATANGP